MRACPLANIMQFPCTVPMWKCGCTTSTNERTETAAGRRVHGVVAPLLRSLYPVLPASCILYMYVSAKMCLGVYAHANVYIRKCANLRMVESSGTDSRRYGVPVWSSTVRLFRLKQYTTHSRPNGRRRVNKRRTIETTIYGIQFAVTCVFFSLAFI